MQSAECSSMCLRPPLLVLHPDCRNFSARAVALLRYNDLNSSCVLKFHGAMRMNVMNSAISSSWRDHYAYTLTLHAGHLKRSDRTVFVLCRWTLLQYLTVGLYIIIFELISLLYISHIDYRYISYHYCESHINTENSISVLKVSYQY